MDRLFQFGPLLLLILLAIAHTHVMATIWAYIAVHNDLGHYILTDISKTAWFYPLLFTHDLLINSLLILPGAVVVALFFDPTRKSFAPLYGAILYVWPHHIEAVGLGFPLEWNPVTLFMALVLVLVPWAQIRFIQRRTYAAV